MPKQYHHEDTTEDKEKFAMPYEFQNTFWKESIIGNPKVSIIIVNWNGKYLLKNCLNSIKDWTSYFNYDVIVIDNGSADGSVEMLRKEFPLVKLVINKENVGFAKANNQGIRRALSNDADYVLLLNNDTKVIHCDWLENMVRVAEADSKNGIVGCKLIFPNGEIQHAGGYVNIKGSHHYTEGDKIKEVDYVTGAAFLIKREVIEKIGFFDEGFSPLYAEEVDYCIRAKRSGYKVIYSPKTVIVHYTGATAKRQAWRLKVFYKNEVRFQLLNYPITWIVGVTFFNLVSTLFEKETEGRKLGVTNFRFRKDGPLRLVYLIRGYLINVKNLSDILRKRKNRTARVVS